MPAYRWHLIDPELISVDWLVSIGAQHLSHDRALTQTWLTYTLAIVPLLYFVLCAAEWLNGSEGLFATVRLLPASVLARAKAFPLSEPVEVGRLRYVLKACSTGKHPRMQPRRPTRTAECV